jgi:4-aminobutyrate aminotransferase-like enzyme
MVQAIGPPPNVVRILAPIVLGSEHVEQLRDALKKIAS